MLTGFMEQFVKILDEGEGRDRDVIVTMKSKQPTRDENLELAALEAVDRRRHLLNARDLLTTEQPDVRNVSKKTRREMGVGAIAPLLNHDVIKDALRKARSKKHTAVGLWAARSVALTLSKDDLHKLSKEGVKEVEAVYENRPLSVPPVRHSSAPPQNVADHTTSAWGVERIGALASWGAFGKRGRTITIGHLDTGVNAKHPALEGKIVKWAEFDKSGREVEGSKPHASNFHGTHTAGTIVGGVVDDCLLGVAPDARLKSALVLGKEGGTEAQLLAGMNWAIQQDVDVINMSLGKITWDYDPPIFYRTVLLEARRAGIPVVVAVGNFGEQTTDSPANDLFALAVGATDYDDRAGGFSGGRTLEYRLTRGTEKTTLALRPYMKPDLSAPGVNVWSASGPKKADVCTYQSGTSMAAPHVSGAIALLLSATTIKNKVKASERVQVITDLLTGSVEQLGEAGQNCRYGWGRINVLRAIAAAKKMGY